MNIEISKELICEVLENDINFKDCDSFEVIEIIEPNILIRYCYPYYDNYGPDGVCDCSFKETESYINIDELEKKCLRWAWDKGYSFEIIPFCVGIVNLETDEQKSFRYTKEDMQNKIPFLSKYTFIACQWILDNQKKGN